MTTETFQMEIEGHERSRCEALERADLETLANLLSDSLVHVHASGRTETKEQYLQGVKERLRFVSVRRDTYEVRPFGDGALAFGVLTQTLSVRGGAPQRMRTTTTQVWRHESGHWRLLAFHATRHAE